MRTIYLYLAIIALFILGCNKEQYKYKQFIDGEEIVYAGLAENFIARGGNLRVQLEWQKSIDPSVAAYMILWNNGKDSTLVLSEDVSSDGVYRTIIEGLPEYVQSFKLICINNRLERSIGQTISGVRIFGSYYQSSLRNRRFLSVDHIDGDSAKLNFLPGDSSLVYSDIIFTNLAGNIDSIRFSKESVIIPSIKSATKAAIRSYYLPQKNAIDTFATMVADSLPVL